MAASEEVRVAWKKLGEEEKRLFALADECATAARSTAISREEIDRSLAHLEDSKMLLTEREATVIAREAEMESLVSRAKTEAARHSSLALEAQERASNAARKAAESEEARESTLSALTQLVLEKESVLARLNVARLELDSAREAARVAKQDLAGIVAAGEEERRTLEEARLAW